MIKFNDLFFVGSILLFLLVIFIKLVSKLALKNQNKIFTYLFFTILGDFNKTPLKMWLSLKLDIVKIKFFFLKNLVKTYSMNFTHHTNPVRNKNLIWRPLVKRISYIGLYANSRANFIKFFKK